MVGNGKKGLRLLLLAKPYTGAGEGVGVGVVVTGLLGFDAGLKVARGEGNCAVNAVDMDIGCGIGVGAGLMKVLFVFSGFADGVEKAEKANCP